jgi:molecular chaperone GrpE
MDDLQDSRKKPLRTSSNKVKDLYNAYIRNEGSRSIPITYPQSSQGEEQKKPENPEQEEIITPEVFESEVNEQLIRENSDLHEKIEALGNEIDELKDQLIRKAAEFENLRRRSVKEKQELIDYANERLIMSLLPVIDDFSKAIDAGRKTDANSPLLQGVELIYQNSLKILDEAGVKQMESSVGKPFDVQFHDALMAMPSEVPEGHVVQEFQPGYLLKDKVIRHAKVVISAGEPNAEEGENNE